MMNFIVAFQYLKGACKKERLFIKACSDRKMNNSFKLKEHRFTLDIKKTIFNMRVVRHWNKWPRS